MDQEKKGQVTCFSKWLSLFRKRQNRKDLWSSAQRTRFERLTRPFLDNLKELVHVAQMSKAAEKFHHGRVARLAFGQFRRNVRLSRRSFRLVSSVLKCWSLHQRMKAFRHWWSVVVMRRAHRVQCQSARKRFEKKRFSAVMLAFAAGSASGGCVPIRIGVREKRRPDTEVEQLEGKLRSLPPGSTTEFLQLIKQINALRAAARP
jgi:hypothetical protein